MLNSFFEPVGFMLVEADYEIIFKIATICLLLSFLGFLLIISVFLTTPEIRKKLAFRMVTNLCITSFLMCATRWASFNPGGLNKSLCFVIGVFNQFTTLSTICWLIMLRVILYDLLVVQNYRMLFAEKRNYLVSYGIPLIFTLIPSLLKLYGADEITCWIVSASNNIHAIIFYLAPVLLAFVGYTYIFLKSFKARIQLQNMNKKDQRLILQFRFYSIPLSLLVLASAIHRIYFAIHPQGTPLWVWIMISVVFQCQTFIISVIFILNPSVRSKILKNIKNGCFWRKEVTNSAYYFTIDRESMGHSSGGRGHSSGGRGISMGRSANSRAPQNINSDTSDLL